MYNISVSDAARLCEGRLCGGDFEDRELNDIVIDSRAVQRGDLFAAFRGERTDGHDYIGRAFESGAACALAERLPEGVTGPVILVPDMLSALEKLCAAYRDTLTLPVVGITGSVGKTSAKEMIWAVLSRRFNTLKTEGNLNNQIGVPMTVSRIAPEHQAAVVEMGISGFGEMRSLAKMTRPDVAVFTVIGHAHLEFLHDLEGVFRAKTELLEYMKDDGVVIVNGDDRLLRALKCQQRKISCGLGEDCDVRAVNVETQGDGHTVCDIVYGGRTVHADIPAYGQHMVYAALEGAAAGFALGLEDEEIERGIADYRTVGRRGAVTRTEYLTLVDDCYNANPDSMSCAVDSLVRLPGRHVCIFSDMLEMGGDSPRMHYDVGRYAAENGVELILSCGEFGRELADGAGERGAFFESREAMVKALPQLIRPGDTVLVKASRGVHLDEVSEALKELKPQ